MVRQNGINPADFREPIQKLLNPEEPHSDLVPLGNTGIYLSPDKPVEPWDCERWDGSPFCSGNPWGGFQPTIDVSPVFDKCNIGIQLQPQGFGVKFPEFQVVYRRPECRVEEPPPPIERAEKNEKQNWNQYKFKDTDVCICFLGITYYSESLVYRPGGLETFDKRKGSVTPTGSASFNLVKGKVPLLYQVGRGWEFGRIKATFKTEGEFNEDQRKYGNYYGSRFWPSPYTVEVNHDVIFTNRQYGDGYFYYGGEYFYFPQYQVYFFQLNIPGTIWLTPRTGIIYALYGEWRNIKGAFPDKRQFSKTTYPNGEYSLNVNDFEILGLALAQPPEPKKYKNPPPPPSRKCCTMACCPPKNSDNNDRLLRLILQKVQKLEKLTGTPEKPTKTLFDGLDRIIKFLGIKEMPAKFPKRLIYPNGKGQVQLDNLLEILGYQVKQLDRAIGHLPQKIKVTDTNPAQAGNQSVEVEIHSLADFNREILKYIIDTEGDGDATNNMLVRCLYELGFIHQGVVQSGAMLDALVEWADFKQKYKKIKVPFAFDPYAGQKGKVGEGFDKQKNNEGKGATTEEEVENLLPKLLQNKEIEIRILVNGEAKSVNDLLMDIKRDTAAAAAGVTDKASAERLEQLVAASQVVLKLQGAIDRNNTRTALTAGLLKTKPKKKT